MSNLSSKLCQVRQVCWLNYVSFVKFDDQIMSNLSCLLTKYNYQVCELNFYVQYVKLVKYRKWPKLIKITCQIRPKSVGEKCLIHDTISIDNVLSQREMSKLIEIRQIGYKKFVHFQKWVIYFVGKTARDWRHYHTHRHSGSRRYQNFHLNISNGKKLTIWENYSRFEVFGQ